jgi:hypothetical protein
MTLRPSLDSDRAQHGYKATISSLLHSDFMSSSHAASFRASWRMALTAPNHVWSSVPANEANSPFSRLRNTKNPGTQNKCITEAQWLLIHTQSSQLSISGNQGPSHLFRLPLKVNPIACQSTAPSTVALLNIVPLGSGFGGESIWKSQSYLGYFPNK